jgi:hypothetical protein
VQPVDSPDQKALGCTLNFRDDYEKYKFSINQCESHVKSDLDTIYLNVNTSDAKKLKFLIDTGAEISIIKGSSLNPGSNYQLRKSIDIKGICSAVLKTECIVELKLLTESHETAHTSRVRRTFCITIRWYFGKGFFGRESVINYCSRQIIMNNEVIINLHVKPCVGKTEPCRLTLQARTEHIVNVPTNYKGLGILDNGIITRNFSCRSID